MNAVRRLVFILCLMTSYAFVPPNYNYHKGNDKAKKAQQTTGILERNLTDEKLPLLMLTDESSEVSINARTKKPILPTEFKSLKEQNEHLVDKTNFISDFINDEYTNVMITRPRGFGKSFTYSMLYHFLNINENSTDLFKGTSVGKKRDFCKKHQNQYPVIRFSFGELKEAKTWNEAENLIKTAFRKMFDDHTHMIPINPEGMMTIQTLTNQLHDRLKKKSIVLIDGYDTPIRTAFYHGYYDKMIQLLRPLYLSALTYNPFVHKSLILGESGFGNKEVFSEVQHLQSYTVMEPRYSSYFGFTAAETRQLIRDYSVFKGVIVDMARKYGGYRFGNHILFNPYSVTQCLKNVGKSLDYWMDSARDFLKLMNSSGIVPLFESEVLLMKYAINHTYNVHLTHLDVKNDLDAFWTLVTDSGYVTVTEKHEELSGKCNCKLALPNEEVSDGFGRFINDFYVRHKNILPFTQFKKMLGSQNSSGSLNCLKSYFDSVLQYFAAEEVSDTLSQMKVLIKTLSQGLGKYYNMCDTAFKNDHLAVALIGRPSDVPLAIYVRCWSCKKELYTGTKLMMWFPIQYCRLSAKVRSGSVISDGKIVWFLMMDMNGNWIQQCIDIINRWIGDPVENRVTQFKTCLKNWFLSNIK